MLVDTLEAYLLGKKELFEGLKIMQQETEWVKMAIISVLRNGGIDAATEQIRAKQYAEPFNADKRKVVALAIELDDKGKGLVDWKEV